MQGIAMLDVVLVLVTTFASQTWLQALHVVKNNHDTNLLKGISLTGLIITIISESLWIFYAHHYNLMGGLSNALLSMTSVAVISIVLYKNNIISLKNIATYSSMVFLLFVVLNIIPINIITVCAMIMSTIFLIPQTIKTVRSIGTEHINGMSNYSIAMIIVANTIWIVYGYYYSAHAYLISSTVLLLCGVIMGVSKMIHHQKYPKKTFAD